MATVYVGRVGWLEPVCGKGGEWLLCKKSVYGRESGVARASVRGEGNGYCVCRESGVAKASVWEGRGVATVYVGRVGWLEPVCGKGGEWLLCMEQEWGG